VEPGEQDQCVADADPMERVGEDGIDLEHGFGGALEGLVRGIRRRAQPRVDDADRAHGVRLDSVHRCTSLARAAVRVIQAPLWGRSKMWSARCRRGADGSYGTSWVCSGKDQMAVAELVPEVAVLDRGAVGALEELVAASRPQHLEVGGLGLVPAGEQ